MNIRRIAVLLVTFILAGSITLSLTHHSDAAPPPPAQPSHHNGPGIKWAHYQLGDSPVDEHGIFEWTKPGGIRNWKRMPPSMDQVGEYEYVWFETKIPSGPTSKPVEDPHLLFSNARYEFEVYSGTEMLFRYGALDDSQISLLPGKAVFASLEGISPNRPLMLRVHSQSDSTISGKIGFIEYGSLANLQLNLIKGDILNGIGMLIFFIIGLLSMLMYFINRDNRANLYFALFSLLICCDLMFTLNSLVLFYDISTFTMYMEELLHGAMVYLFALYFVHLLKPVFEKLVLTVGKLVLVIGVLTPIVMWLQPALFLEFSEEIAFARNLGFSCLCAVSLIIIAISFRRQIHSDAKWFVVGFSLYLILNMIGHPLRLYFESNPSRFEIGPLEMLRVLQVSLDYSLLFSTIFFGIISFKRYAEVYTATRNYNKQLASWNQSLELKVKERTRSLQNLLDHAGQGFLTFGNQLSVQKEYSIECHRLFQQDITDCSYVELLYPNDAAEQALHKEILSSVFLEDELQREVCLSLLPIETDVLGKRVSLQYKWISEIGTSSGKVMVVITDISERRQLENQMVKERQALHMVVWVIKHYRDFKEMVEEYREFALKGKTELMSRKLSTEEMWSELTRLIHTFKGNFAQIDFIYMTEKLHDLESQLFEWKEQITDDMSDTLATSLLKEWLEQFDFIGWLEEDLCILRDILGNRFDIGQETITIELERLHHLEQEVYTILPSQEAKVIVSELKKLQYRPFKELLGMYSEYTVKLAERMDKEIHPIHMIGGEMLVNPEKYSNFVRTLIHIFRNMIDHGIETPEERASSGKDRRGTIVCEISENEQGIQLFLSNDGREMDLAGIREYAAEKGICTNAEFDAMSVNDQRLLIFHEGFTTKNTISDLSGRGVGLSAVHKALDDLNGTVHIESSKEEGTSFSFMLPRLESRQRK